MKSTEFIIESSEYDILRQASDAADTRLIAASKELDKFPKGPMGLTPDDVKRDPAWQKIKKESDQAFKELRYYNGLISKNHKKEHRATIDARRAARYTNAPINELKSQDELVSLEQQLDRMFASLGLDVEFSRHFVERLLGREKQVTADEIAAAFEKLKRKYKGKLLKAKKATSRETGALQDFDSDLNILFGISPNKDANGVQDLVGVTVKQKDPDKFHTDTPSGKATPYPVGTRK